MRLTVLANATQVRSFLKSRFRMSMLGSALRCAPLSDLTREHARFVRTA